MIKKISYFLSNYKIERERLDKKASFKDSLLASINSLVITGIIFLIPALLIFNLLVLDYLITFLIILIFVLLVLFSLSFSYFYVLLLKTNIESLQSFKFRTLIIVETTIFSIILSIIGIVVISVVM